MPTRQAKMPAPHRRAKCKVILARFGNVFGVEFLNVGWALACAGLQSCSCGFVPGPTTVTEVPRRLKPTPQFHQIVRRRIGESVYLAAYMTGIFGRVHLDKESIGIAELERFLIPARLRL